MNDFTFWCVVVLSLIASALVAGPIGFFGNLGCLIYSMVVRK